MISSGMTQSMTSVVLPHSVSFSARLFLPPQSYLNQLQPVRVAVRREGSLQCSCGRQLGRLHTQVAIYTSVAYLPPTPFCLNPAPEHCRHLAEVIQRLRAMRFSGQGSVEGISQRQWFHEWKVQGLTSLVPRRELAGCHVQLLPLVPVKVPTLPLECLNPRRRGSANRNGINIVLIFSFLKVEHHTHFTKKN